MKLTNRHLFRQRGDTLIELMVSTAIIAITGTIIYYILNTGMTLFAKNTAINIAHQEARVAVLQMEQDLHGAVSIPQLTDASRNAIAGNGPAAGISFQLFASGPFMITPNASAAGYPAGQNQVTVRFTGGVVPVVGQRLIIPTHQTELDITAVGSGSGDVPVTLSANLPQSVITLQGSPASQVNIACFLTDRVTYVVNGTQLYYYGRQRNNNYKVIANDLTSPTPFSIPVTPLGAPFNRFVAAINLITADATSSNRKFRAANMFINAMEPYRARLCTYQ
ncbi:MAG: prepilin-type N-terminal cleavage/methylation domain-containing protein [Chthoniobacter sp.]|nr:prepilin-type N-terminal cleavage/methylation domain-containing protein [Chthoniobacter sp.]